MFQGSSDSSCLLASVLQNSGTGEHPDWPRAIVIKNADSISAASSQMLSGKRLYKSAAGNTRSNPLEERSIKRAPSKRTTQLYTLTIEHEKEPFGLVLLKPVMVLGDCRPIQLILTHLTTGHITYYVASNHGSEGFCITTWDCTLGK